MSKKNKDIHDADWYDSRILRNLQSLIDEPMGSARDQKVKAQTEGLIKIREEHYGHKWS